MNYNVDENGVITKTEEIPLEDLKLIRANLQSFLDATQARETLLTAEVVKYQEEISQLDAVISEAEAAVKVEPPAEEKVEEMPA